MISIFYHVQFGDSTVRLRWTHTADCHPQTTSLNLKQTTDMVEQNYNNRENSNLCFLLTAFTLPEIDKKLDYESQVLAITPLGSNPPCLREHRK